MSVDAVWLGGPPGNRGDNIRSKLTKYGINFVRIYEYLSSDDRFPSTTTKLVILNVEMCSHGMQDLGKKEAARIHAAFVMGGFGLSRMITNLARTGLIDPSKTVEHDEPDVDDAVDEQTNKETENMKPFPTSSAPSPQSAPSAMNAPSTTNALIAHVDHGSIESQAADALLNIERWPALRTFLLRGIVEALSKEAGVSK
jgi:hypothetical protein